MLIMTPQSFKNISIWWLFRYGTIKGESQMIVKDKMYKEVKKEGFSKSYTVYKEYLIWKCPETWRKRKVELTELDHISDSLLEF